MDFNGYYSFDQNALPQTATTDLFGSECIPNSTCSHAYDEDVLQQTLTDLNTSDESAWKSAQPLDSQWISASTFATVSDADAPFEIDESDVHILQSHQLVAATGRAQPLDAPVSETHPAMATIPVYALFCDWPGCAFPQIFMNTLARSQHVTDTHIVDVLNDPSRKCTWPGCRSKSVFRTFKLLEAHVNNIHINPLCCTVPQCKHKRPFSKQGDLDRHILSVHNAKLSFKWPYLQCSRYKRGFARKDKLKDHINNNGHGTFHCKYHHCRNNKYLGFFSLEDAIKHELSHPVDGYECAIGSCRDSSSRFEANQLKQHLTWQHNLGGFADPLWIDFQWS